jgi:plasmid stabilization system protein ParE
LEYFVYIGERNFDAAERFLTAAEEACLKLAEMPQMGRV